MYVKIVIMMRAVGIALVSMKYLSVFPSTFYLPSSVIDIHRDERQGF